MDAPVVVVVGAWQVIIRLDKSRCATLGGGGDCVRFVVVEPVDAGFDIVDDDGSIDSSFCCCCGISVVAAAFVVGTMTVGLPGF
jgi:hypothetical protein